MSDRDSHLSFKLPEGLLDHEARIAVLEAHHVTQTTDMAELKKGQTQILEILNKQKGTIGGIALVFSGIMGVMMVFREWIIAHLK